MALEIFIPKEERIIVFIAYSDLAWAMETNLIPGAETRLAIDPYNGDYGFYSFGDNPPPDWYDCGPIPSYPILIARANVARQLYPNEAWENCQGGDLPPAIATLAEAEDTAFLRAWRKAAFAEEFTPFTLEDNPLTPWIAALAEANIEIKLMRG
ncbi:MAG: hypothetical protein AB1489_43040 [Acidobacteriota bacterium]